MHLKIIKAGLLDSIQDGGRFGYQHQGINPGGAMDLFSMRLANALLGKELDAPVIELHFPAAQIFFEKAAIFCLAGADFSPVINAAEIPLHRPIAVSAGTTLSFQQRRKGARCYLCLLNEIKLEPWLNSYSTNIRAGAGGYEGRRLQKGDSLPFKALVFTTEMSPVFLPWQYHRNENTVNEVAFFPGPEWNWLTTKSQTAFLNESFTISASSDRMGYRLNGVALHQKNEEQLVSSGVSFGTVQRLPNGQLIVLMADHQTTGGYPRIASVISAHLPKLAQMTAGNEMRFVMTTIAEAEAKFMAQQKYLKDLQNTCKLKIENWLHAHRH